MGRKLSRCDSGPEAGCLGALASGNRLRGLCTGSDEFAILHWRELSRALDSPRMAVHEGPAYNIARNSSMKRRLAIPLLLLAICMPSLAQSTAPSLPATRALPAAPQSADVDRRALGIDLLGKSVDPVQRAAGKPVVLVFVRTDCPISNRYAPTIQELQAYYTGRVEFWLVYPDRDESSVKIQRHLQEYGYKLPVLRDPEHLLVEKSHVQITPEVAVFEGSGQLAYHGRIDNWYVTFGRARVTPTTHELKDALQALLSGRKPAVTAIGGVGCYISDLQ
jgi:hypothetical protein